MNADRFYLLFRKIGIVACKCTRFLIILHTISMIQYFHYDKPFALELGGELPELTIAYHTFGTRNQDADNVVWVDWQVPRLPL